MNIESILIIVAIGLVAGIVSGTMGVGGGVILIPGLVFFLGFSQKMAQGTSLALMAFPVFVVSAYNYWKEGYVDIKVALILLVTFILGSYFGSQWAVKLPGKLLRQIFGGFLFLLSIKLLFGK